MIVDKNIRYQVNVLGFVHYEISINTRRRLWLFSITILDNEHNFEKYQKKAMVLASLVFKVVPRKIESRENIQKRFGKNKILFFKPYARLLPLAKNWICSLNNHFFFLLLIF